VIVAARAALVVVGLAAALPALSVDDLRAAVVSVRDLSGDHLRTGLIVSADGYIVTTTWLNSGESRSRVVVRYADGAAWEARVIGEDLRTKLVVLKVDGNPTAPARIAEPRRLAVGDAVQCMCMEPDGEPASVRGTVRALDLAFAWAPFVPYIETSVGDFDGPLFNARGEAVGLNHMMMRDAPERAFAIPIELAMRVQAQLRQHGRVIRGRIGFVIREVTEDIAAAKGLAAPAGAMVEEVEKNGPADRAGLKKGDILLEVDGKPVPRSRYAIWLISASAPGTRISLRVWRDGAFQTMRATVGELLEPRPQ
jgi:serine protease Do